MMMEAPKELFLCDENNLTRAPGLVGYVESTLRTSKKLIANFEGWWSDR